MTLEKTGFAIAKILSTLLGLALVYSGYIHLQNPYQLYDHILRYELISGWPALSLAMFLPWLNVLIGYGLVFQSRQFFVPLAGLFLMLTYWGAVSQAWARGLNIQCGCFGNQDVNINLFTVARNSCLVLICIGLLFVASKKNRGLVNVS